MARVTATLTDTGRLRGTLRRLGNRADNLTRGFIARHTFELQREIQRLAPVDTGIHRRGIVTSFSPAGLSGRVESTSGYGRWLEEGTDPHFPPVAPLEEWARRHGMPGMGFAIARAIAERGTPAQPHFRPAIRRQEPRFRAEARQLFRGRLA